MNKILNAIALSIVLGGAASSALGTSHSTAAGTAALSQAEVRRVDKEAGKITLRHGPIANLDMPPMTMVFQVKDRAMLEQVKTGDKVGFTAEKIDGAYIVTRIESSK